MWIDDVVLKECASQHHTNLFIQKDITVVLGRGNKEEN